MDQHTCQWPVRVPTDAPWDLAFPTTRECGEEASHRLEVWGFVDEQRDPRIAPTRHVFHTIDACPKHAYEAKNLGMRMVGPLIELAK